MDQFNTAVLNDRDLLYGGIADQVVENKASARRWARLVEIHGRQSPTEGNFPMSAREWTTAAVCEAWGMSEARARQQLNVALFLSEQLPGVWELCLSGALDAYRAQIVADLLRHLRRHGEGDLVMCTITQLRNKVNYEVRLLVSGDGEFERQFAERGVRAVEFEDGMGQLSVASSIDQVRLARHRLWLSAKALRAAGDERTVEQLMADVALDLLIGWGEGVPVPQFARPIINVTVSLETLAGLAEDPALLSGGTVIPAVLARAIATREGATWFRLLTDPVGESVALSTKSYQPTAEIWRYVVATEPTCVHPACDRPAVECELDHQVPWPQGATEPGNLQPLCRRHHKAKHARAERPDLDWEFGLAA